MQGRTVCNKLSNGKWHGICNRWNRSDNRPSDAMPHYVNLISLFRPAVHFSDCFLLQCTGIFQTESETFRDATAWIPTYTHDETRRTSIAHLSYNSILNRLSSCALCKHECKGVLFEVSWKVKSCSWHQISTGTHPAVRLSLWVRVKYDGYHEEQQE
jgi:hypothetical protein